MLALALGVLAACFPASTDRFDFHESFWLNLHHFLYALAQDHAAKDGVRPKTWPLAIRAADADRVALFTPEERDVWQAALAYYKNNAIARDLLFDDGLVKVKTVLSSRDPAALEDAGLSQALEKAAPVYRARFWEEHARANCAFVEALLPLEKRFGERLAPRVAAGYGARWPAERTAVDVVAYANWAGAYTTNDPTHVTVSSTDPKLEGVAALEILFHEASHGLDAGLSAAIVREATRLGKPAPRDLWHAVIFYTTGELVRREVGGAYVPYAKKHGLYERGPWKTYERALDAHWLSLLDRESTFEDALHNLVSQVLGLCHEDAARAAYRNVAAWGLVDVFREKHPEGHVYSWWDYRQLAFPRNQGLRLDLILATETLARRATEATIDRDARKAEVPSDHAPVIAVFQARPRGSRILTFSPFPRDGPRDVPERLSGDESRSLCALLQTAPGDPSGRFPRRPGARGSK